MATSLDDPDNPYAAFAPLIANDESQTPLAQFATSQAQPSLHRAPPTAPQLTPQQLYALQQQDNRRQWAQNSPFMSGLASGWEGLKGGAHSLAALAGGAVGATNFARGQLQDRAQDQALQADYDTGTPQSLGDIHGIGDAFDWAEHSLGEAIPGIAATVLPAIATGGMSALGEGLVGGAALRGAAESVADRAIGGEAARLAAERGLGDVTDAAAQAELRQQAARNLAAKAGSAIADDTPADQVEGMARDTLADRALPRLKQLAQGVSDARAPVTGSARAMLREAPGAIGGGTVLSAEGASQDVNPNQSDAQLEANSRKALLGALGEGALMAVPGLALMRRYGVGAAADAALAEKMSKPLLQRLATQGAEQGAIMGGTNVAADAANKVLHNWITGQGLTSGLVSHQALTSYLNDLASGAVIGSITGAPAAMRFSDLKVPGLGAGARIAKALRRVQAKAAKPGEEVNPDGTAKAPSAAPAPDNTDVGAVFHQKLDQVQNVPSSLSPAFEGIKPYDVHEDDNTHEITIGTSGDSPGAALFDPVENADAKQAYPGDDNRINAAVASLLPREAILSDTTDAAVRATAKAIQSGFESLDGADQTHVGQYLNMLSPEQQTPFKRLLMTVGIMSDDQRAGLTRAPSTKATDAADAATIGANDESRPSVGTQGGEGGTGLEGDLTEQAAAPAADALNYIPDTAWKKAHLSPHAHVGEGVVDATENVPVDVTNSRGTAERQMLNLKMLAGALSRSPEGRELLSSAESAGQSRVATALTTILHEAQQRGEHIDLSTSLEGGRLFPDREGEPGSGLITAKDVDTVRKQLHMGLAPDTRTALKTAIARSRQPVEERDSTPTQQRVMQTARALDEANSAHSAAVDAARSAPNDARRVQDVLRAHSARQMAAQQHAAALEARAAELEAGGGRGAADAARRALNDAGVHDEDIEGRAHQERPLGAGDFDQAATDPDQAFTPTVHAPAGLGETMSVSGSTGGRKGVAKLNAAIKEHQADVAHRENQLGNLRKLYEQVRTTGREHAEAGDQAHVEQSQRRLNGIKAKALRLKAEGLRQDAAFEHQRTNLEHAVREGGTDITATEHGARPSPVAGRDSQQAHNELRRIDEAAHDAQLMDPSTRGAEHNDPQRVAQLYKGAKLLLAGKSKRFPAPSAEQRAAASKLIGAAQRLADGDKRLTRALDAADEDLTPTKAPTARATKPATLADHASELSDEQLNTTAKRLSAQKDDLNPQQKKWLSALKKEAQARAEERGATKKSVRRAQAKAAQDKMRIKAPAKSEVSLEASKVDDTSLDRAPDDPRSVAETVKAAKKNPAYKALFKALRATNFDQVNRAQRESKLQGIVNALSKAFKVEPPQVHLFGKDEWIEHNGDMVSLSGDLGMLQRPGGGKRAIMHLRDDLRPHEVVSTLLHEFGHHLQHELFDKLPDLHPTRLAIMQDFKRWRSQWKDPGNARARDVRASRAPFFGTMADLRLGGEGKRLDAMSPEEQAKYLTSFPEYFADMTARALSEHVGVQSIVGRFFGRVAHAMKLVYDLMTGSDRKLADAPQSFRDFVAQTYAAGSSSPEHDAQVRSDAANELSGKVTPEKLTGAEEASNSAGDTPAGKTPPPGADAGRPHGNDGSQPSDITYALNFRDRGLLEKLSTRVDVVEKILTEFPQLRNQLLQKSTQLETALNATYALWAAGKLKLTGEGRGVGYAGAFRRFSDKIANAFGLKNEAELGERIFKELKAGAEIRKTDVGARQRADYLTDLNARRAKSAGADRAVLSGRIALRRSINAALHFKHETLERVVDRALRGMDERLRKTNVPALRRLGTRFNRMTGERGSDESFVNQIHRLTAMRANRLSSIIGNLSPEDDDLLTKHLMLGTAIKDNPRMEQMRKAVLAYTTQFDRSSHEGGAHGSISGGFFPWRFDHAAARANMDEVHSLMGEIRKDPKLDRHAREYFAELYKREHLQDAIDTPEARRSAKARAAAMHALDEESKKYAAGLSHDVVQGRMEDILTRDPVAHMRDEVRDDPLMGNRPKGWTRSLNPRAFNAFKQAGRQDLLERLQKFQAHGVLNTLLPYVHAMTRREVFYKNFVHYQPTAESLANPNAKDRVMEQHSVLDDDLAEAKAQGATDKDLQLARDYADAQLGTYGDPNGPRIVQKILHGLDSVFETKMSDPESRTWEKLTDALTTYQNIRVLGLGILGNMIDPLGVWTRSSSLRTAFDGYRHALKANFGKSNNTYLRAQAEALGIVERYALNESLGMIYNAGGTSGTLSYKLNHALFHYNGMEMVTRFGRLAALAGAHKFLLEHARGASPHSARYLDELGLKASDIKPDAQHPGFVDTSDEKVQKALFQFVDESVVRPHAGQRPLWHSDPGLRMFSQYRGFVFSFYDTIMKRMMHEVKNGNIGGVAPMAGYLGVTLAAEMARELIQYGPGGNPERQGWGAPDYTMLALERSGALGPRADFMNSMYPELAHSRVPIPYESLSGPTVSQADQLVDTALGRGGEANTLEQTLPVESIYHGWLHRPKTANTHQSAGQVVANFADDFVLE